MRLDGLGLFVDDMAKMIRFYKDVLGFEIKEEENTSNVYLVKDGTLFLLYGRNDFEKMTNRRYEYIKGLNGHFEMALYVDTFEEVDEAYKKAVENGANHVFKRCFQVIIITFRIQIVLVSQQMLSRSLLLLCLMVFLKPIILC